ncbi:hypothetical protein MBLNU457_6235t2 [Dothideomycetes sp. NU457]
MARGGAARGPPSREVQVSKKLSWLLRHNAEKEGLKLGPGGYINLKDVRILADQRPLLEPVVLTAQPQLNNRNLKGIKVTFAEVREIVSTNDKQRFSLIPVSAALDPSKTTEVPADDAATAALAESASDDPADYLIRANQGHSIAVENEGLLTPITSDNLPTIVVHGTTHGAWPLIVSSGGLKRMGRTHVHFASGLPSGMKSIADSKTGDEQTASAPVISGMRNSSSVLVYVDIKKAIEGGLKFWKSENGVILSEGDSDGLIKLEYFERVEDRSSDVGVLVEGGKIIKEFPEEWKSKGTGRRGGRGFGKG